MLVDFTRLLEKTTCWSISGEVSQERATKEHYAAGARALCFVQLNLLSAHVDINNHSRHALANPPRKVKNA